MTPEASPSRATPIARHLLREHGLDPRRVVGTGAAGRIGRRDVATALAHLAPSASPAPASSPVMAASTPAAAPTAWMLVDVDLTAYMRAGGEALARAAVARGAVLSLREHPALNAAWAGRAIRRYGHLLLAVAGAPGVTQWFIDESAASSLTELAAILSAPPAVTAPAVPAPAVPVTPIPATPTGGPTFTLTWLDRAAPARLQQSLPVGQAAGLTAGAVRRRLVATDDGLAWRHVGELALLFDHRVLDGAPVGHYLATLRAWLEGSGVAEATAAEPAPARSKATPQPR